MGKTFNLQFNATGSTVSNGWSTHLERQLKFTTVKNNCRCKNAAVPGSRAPGVISSATPQVPYQKTKSPTLSLQYFSFPALAKTSRCQFPRPRRPARTPPCQRKDLARPAGADLPVSSLRFAPQRKLSNLPLMVR